MRSRFTVFILIMFLAMQSAGCVILLAGGAGAGTVVYFKGQLEEDINAPEAKIYAASISALKQLKLPVVEDEHDTLTAKIKSRLANGKDIWISIESSTAGSSKLTIRVGIWGDEEKSRMIRDTVHKYL